MSTIFDDIQREFHVCVKKRAEIVKKLEPLREKVDVCEAEKQKVDLKIQAAVKNWRATMDELGLFDLDNHIARLARALDGKTGKPPKDL